jgi:hypothetical protein
VALTDGAAHAVDSNELAFRLAAIGGFRAAYADANPTVLEPIMKVGGAAGGCCVCSPPERNNADNLVRA